MFIEPLGLKHQEILEARFSKLSSEISEYTFANLYLFRKVHRFEVVNDGDLFILGIARDGKRYLMPTSPIQELDFNHLKDRLREVDYLFPVREEDLSYFNLDEYSRCYRDDESDYVYLTETFRNYPGRDLSGRRNLVKQFTSHYSYESVVINPNNIEDAREVLNHWNMSKMESDYEACLEALNLFEQLKLMGKIYYVEGKPAGFVIGEKLNSNTFVEHFSKVAEHYKGIYQFMYQEFAKELDHQFIYIDMEQDLGDEGLRQSKRSYHPFKMVQKFRIAPL